MSLPVVAIVGRPNVGKSTLFNRVLGKTLAVVDDVPGITRDRLYAQVDWAGKDFNLVDTGGWVPAGSEAMDQRILHQVLRALEECDLVIFLVDVRDGIQTHDEEIARHLHRLGIPCILAANKVDSERLEPATGEFASLGLGGTPIGVSAISGRGLGELLDRVVEAIPTRVPSRDAGDAIRIAVLGRPNVGKSSIVNRLLGEERMIVHDAPGTTRDAIDTPFRYHGRAMVVVDTAGIRKKLSSHPDFEFYATLRAIRSLDAADVALLVFDASQPISRQDQRIAGLIEDAGRACVWIFNKWDLVEKDEKTSAKLLEAVRGQISFQNYAPAEFVSALTVQRVSRIPQRIVEVYEASRIKVGTAELNECVRRAIDRYPPRSVGGERPLKIYYATQVRAAPPTIALHVSQPRRLAKSYERYLAREIRAAFGFTGSPIRLQIRKSK
jgi:GTP-binding protein